MRCLVTGAAGFIGSHLCEKLLEQGHAVRGVDAFTAFYARSIKTANLDFVRRHRNFEFMEGDLVSLDMRQLLEGVEWVFHQAAQAGVRASWGSHFESYIHDNIDATQRLLEEATRASAIRKIVFASSSSVYGNAENSPTSEATTPQPVSPYGVTKLAAEHLMTLYATELGLPTVSLRYFTVFGPRQRPDMAFHRFIKAALTREQIVIYGDGEQSRDFTYVSDVVQANLLAAQHAKSGQVINIGGGPHATVNQVVEILQTIVGKLEVRRVARQPGDARHTCADISMAHKLLRFLPAVSLVDGIQQEVNWLKQQL